MKCPRCGEGLEKKRLDVYQCLECVRVWLIHELKAQFPLMHEVVKMDKCENKGSFEYCKDGPPGCEWLCLRRTSNNSRKESE